MLQLPEKPLIIVDKEDKKMKKIILLLLVFNYSSFSQDVLLQLEEDQITLDEFKHIFNKNNDDVIIDNNERVLSGPIGKCSENDFFKFLKSGLSE